MRTTGAMTNAGATTELFAGFGSVGEPVTLAEALMAPADTRVTTIWNVADAPFARLATAQFTGPDPVQAPAGLLDTNAVPPGKVKLAVADVAVDGPPLAIVTWYVRFCPAIAEPTVDSATARSAVGAAPAIVVNEATLFAAFGSAVDAVTLTELFSVPAAGTVTTIWNVVDAAFARLAAVQTTGPIPVQAPAGEVETKMTPAGRLKVSAIPVAADGPPLVATI